VSKRILLQVWRFHDEQDLAALPTNHLSFIWLYPMKKTVSNSTTGQPHRGLHVTWIMRALRPFLELPI